MSNDQQIQSDVLAELGWDARVAPNEVGVSVKDGVVTLSGQVESYIKKWAAEDAALRVRGVKAVANNIEVKLPSDDRRSDADIAAAAASALKWNTVIPSGKIRATVSKGWVTLQGEVDWQFQKEAAEREVRNLKGVLGVTNLITVAPRIEPSDVKKKIEEALVRSVKTDAKNIDVEVQGSKVVLKGTVHSYAEKIEAEHAAWQAPGITTVEDRLSVAYY